MSKKEIRKLDRSARAQAAHENKNRRVKMSFSENKYYNDLNNPIFEGGKTYVLEGAAWIMRWQKRGGTIVEELEAAAPQQAPIPVTLPFEPPTPEPEPVAEVEEKQENVAEELEAPPAPVEEEKPEKPASKPGKSQGKIQGKYGKNK